MKTKKFLFCLTFILVLSACGKPEGTFKLYENEEFKDITLCATQEDLNKLGIDLGDSCNITFSNGFELKDIPFFDGYYTKVNFPLICAYPGFENVDVAYQSGDSMWEKSGCDENTTATVSLAEKGKYLDMQKTLSMKYSTERNDYKSDEEFCNFRAMTGGRLKKGTFFRGASPIDDRNKRMKATDGLIRKAKINFILDLADGEAKTEKYKEEESFYQSSLFSELLNEEKVALLGLTPAYKSEDFAKKLVGGLRKMMAAEGPYYIHCTEGKDRTGFVCVLLEALVGATYEEIENDYMETYKNYYGITKEKDKEKCDMVKETRLDDMVYFICGVPEGSELSEKSLEDGAKEYLRRGGMTDGEISSFISFMCE